MALDPERFKFIDESGVNLAMTRRYGRAQKGERVIGAVPQNYGANVTMLAALGSQGVEAVMTIDGATDAEVFRVYVARMLRPTLRQGDIVIMDNLRAHKAAGIREAIEQTGARLQYLPPYSPDLSPIEPCWSKLKTALRTAKARTRQALEHAIAQALATITASDARSWFHDHPRLWGGPSLVSSGGSKRHVNIRRGLGPAGSRVGRAAQQGADENC